MELIVEDSNYEALLDVKARAEDLLEAVKQAMEDEMQINEVEICMNDLSLLFLEA